MSSDEAAYADLFDRLERERGFRGNLYRQKCLRRRVAVRMRARGVADVSDYSALLDNDPEEYERLLRVLTINVSKFFRNQETWVVIREEVMPELLQRGGPLLMWSAGSACGEEAYSLAILAWDWLARTGFGGWNGIRIIGTDIDGRSLDAARTGEYPAAALDETPADLKRQWFEADGPYRLKEPIPRLVEFRQRDILAGRPEFDADLILCRNLLIYLDREAQRQVFEIFVETLRSGGFLVLGRVEMLDARVRDVFEVVNPRERIYRKR
ncbi:MAG: protein-glutamate O-methyltransferase CheR [Gemmatimonadetes bacterium]|uniref:protein-glutamate O-methyltransferase n=1 Tax=Candidatus Kutchimonas denitrificans TaxID=3056748 RepID=A0AAE4Z7Q2_9BACT|nr:protein-glutamate O-methyltransferase CheR [Gemmatimonadota bacterium]NIR74533.1 protein-glutamate O-methyltransferase CheR [Candidatus Kutchimonas denitrificans]NIS02723.1 protein-glutamate O-methyltransferase CheR [Gemmatimonadota bacterium]NIT68884.1 protein-glutamate O-methyltransferase CheR [Gemmatimonadota bacterium]NIU52189.1 protein-glutamate O-methyltransferase CheR [Gemmatimonadota bacterium]